MAWRWIELVMCAGRHKNSKTAHKDMGGLLQEGSRDFLVYRLGESIISHTWPCQCHALASVNGIWHLPKLMLCPSSWHGQHGREGKYWWNCKIDTMFLSSPERPSCGPSANVKPCFRLKCCQLWIYPRYIQHPHYHIACSLLSVGFWQQVVSGFCLWHHSLLQACRSQGNVVK